MFLIALSDYFEPPSMITVVKKEDNLSELSFIMPSDAIVKILEEETDEYKLLNGKTTFYVCQGHICMPPMNRQQFVAIINQNNHLEDRYEQYQK